MCCTVDLTCVVCVPYVIRTLMVRRVYLIFDNAGEKELDGGKLASLFASEMDKLSGDVAGVSAGKEFRSTGQRGRLTLVVSGGIVLAGTVVEDQTASNNPCTYAC